MRVFFYVCAAIGATLGILTIIATAMGATTAPQEAAGYAMASALAIVPYVFARAIDLAIDEPSKLLRRVAMATEKTLHDKA